MIIIRWSRKYLLVIAYLLLPTLTRALSCQEVKLEEVDQLIMAGLYVCYLEDKTGTLTISEVVNAEYANKFTGHNKAVFSRPATKSAFWFRIYTSNYTSEDAWLEVGSTYAWYIDFYTPTSPGSYRCIKTGTMRPDTSKLYPGNLFWLPLNKAMDTSPKVYYLRIESGLTYELPLSVGTLRSLSKRKTTSDFLTAGFIGALLIMLLYNGFVYLYLRDSLYLYYLGYLFLMLISMPYANNYPFIEHFDFWFFNKQWWNTWFLFWHPPVYFFVGMFCIQYLKLKERAPVLKGIILVEMAIISLGFPVLTLLGFDFAELVNFIQPLIMLFYLSCLFTGYYFLVKKLRPAGFYVLGWTFMVIGALLFFAVINGMLPYRIGTRNALYFGTVIEVWMFSLALGSRLSVLQREKAQMQKEMIYLVNRQKADLERQVSQRTEELQFMNAELEETNEHLNEQGRQLRELNLTKDRLFAVLGHDLQSPLVALENLLQMANFGAITSKFHEKVATKIRGDIQYLQLTLNNLLQWAVSQMEGIRVEKKYFNLHKLVHENILMGQYFATHKHIIVANKIAEELEVYADPNLLQVVFRNLLSNALKFTPQDGIITFSSHQNAYGIEIAVRDTGMGMDEQRRKQLFESVAKESTTGTQGEKGTGLGLMLCKFYIEKNQGKIRVESQEGEGTTFFIELPNAPI